MTSEKFKKPKNFSIRTLLKGSFGVFSPTGDYEILVRFDNFAAPFIKERTWHSSQRLKKVHGGEIDLSLNLTSLNEVEQWILSWGQHAIVLKPKELVERIAEAASAMHCFYSGDSSSLPLSLTARQNEQVNRKEQYV